MRIVFSCAFEISPSIKNQGTTEGFGLNSENMVEAGGIEPPSERFQSKASTCLSSDLNLISTNSQKQDQVETSS